MHPNFTQQGGVPVSVFIPGKNLIATPNTGINAIHLWNMHDPDKLENLEIENSGRIAVNRNGTLLAATFWESDPKENMVISIWDLEEKRMIKALKADITRPLNHPCFSPDGKWLAAGNDQANGPIYVWNVENLEAIDKPIEINNPDNTHLRSLIFSPSGKSLIAGFSNPDRIVCYKVGNNWKKNDIEIDTLGKSILGFFELEFSADGQVMVAANEREIQIFATEPFKRMRTIRTPTEDGWINSVVILPDLNTIVSSTYKGEIKHWDLYGNNGYFRFESEPGRRRDIKFSNDSRYLASAEYDNRKVTTWDIQSSKKIKEFSSIHGEDLYKWGSPASIDFSSDGNFLAVGGSTFDADGYAQDSSPVNYTQIIEIRSGKVIHELKTSDKVCSVDFHPDGSSLAISSAIGNVIIWPFNSKDEPLNIDANFLGNPANDTSNEFNPDGATYSPDGQLLAICDRGGQIFLVDSKTGKQRYLSNPKHHVHRHPVFNPTKPQIPVGTRDRILIWDYEANQTYILKGLLDDVLSLDFSPDGKRLVSSGLDGKIVIWDVEKRTILTELLSGLGKCWGVNFSPDGKSIAVNDSDGYIHLLESEPVSETTARHRMEAMMNQN